MSNYQGVMVRTQYFYTDSSEGHVQRLLREAADWLDEQDEDVIVVGTNFSYDFEEGVAGLNLMVE